MDDLLHCLLRGVDNEVCLRGSLVRVIDTGEALDLASASLGIDALSVHFLAVLEGSRAVNEVEVASAASSILHNVILCSLSAGLVGRNRGGDDSSASSGELSRNVGDAQNVLVPVLVGETKLGRQFASDCFAEKERDRSATLLVENGLKRATDRILARVVKTGQQQGEALLVARRVALPKNLDDGLVGEPIRDGLEMQVSIVTANMSILLTAPFFSLRLSSVPEMSRV